MKDSLMYSTWGQLSKFKLLNTYKKQIAYRLYIGCIHKKFKRKKTSHNSSLFHI